MHAEQACFQQHPALAFGNGLPDHHVEQAALVFQSDEGDATGSLRTLAQGDEARYAHRA